MSGTVTSSVTLIYFLLLLFFLSGIKMQAISIALNIFFFFLVSKSDFTKTYKFYTLYFRLATK